MMVLSTLVAVGALSLAVTAYQQPQGGAQGRGAGGGGQGRGQQGPPVVEVEKLKDNLFVLRGGGGNTAVFVQAKGITVVDTKNPGWGAPILAKIKELSDKPVTTIINTHTHGDHVSGNVEFPATVEVIAHANTAANMKKMAPVTGFPVPASGPPPNIFDTNGGRGLAKRTFTDRQTIGSGADQIDLYYFGRAHTDGDAWVLFPALRVVHAGDVFPGKNIPIMDTNNGGSGVAYPDTLMKAHTALSKSADTIITGHSTQMTFNDLREYSEFNREFLTAVQTATKSNQTAEQIAGTWKIPERFAGYAQPQAARLQANVTAVLGELRK
jgi:glyoxylase-like metal-dependent hydrolase (beta-lactamase superfamily II)